jgi:hypothetical protein
MPQMPFEHVGVEHSSGVAQSVGTTHSGVVPELLLCSPELLLCPEPLLVGEPPVELLPFVPLLALLAPPAPSESPEQPPLPMEPRTATAASVSARAMLFRWLLCMFGLSLMENERQVAPRLY